jgi:hypothetical protein
MNLPVAVGVSSVSLRAGRALPKNSNRGESKVIRFSQCSQKLFNSFCKPDFVIIAMHEPNHSTTNTDAAKAFSPDAVALDFNLFDRRCSRCLFATPDDLPSAGLHFGTGGSNGAGGKARTQEEFRR